MATGRGCAVDVIEAEILADAAKYDVVCTPLTSVWQGRTTGRGDPSGMLPLFTPDGRCVTLLKVLMTNASTTVATA
ncbi:MAG: hypothetical protein ACLSDQ_11195 [Adlercreutzia equolifaciens]